MLRQTYQSAVIPYQLPVPGQAVVYNPELVTPPRIYREEVSILWCLYLRRQMQPDSLKTLGLLLFTDQIYWPSWDMQVHSFNTYAGQHQGVTHLPVGPLFAAWTESLTVGFDGGLWRDMLGTEIQEVTDGLATISVTPYTKFGAAATNRMPIVDKGRDRVVFSAQSGASINVYEWTSGAFIASHRVGAPIAAACAEDDTRIYVLDAAGRLSLINYVTGRILATVRAPINPDYGTVMAWDPQMRRLYFAQRTPDAADGACTITVKGYYVVPLPTQLTRPFPLRAPRAHRTVPVAARLIGDIGEPVSGARVDAVVTGASATLARGNAVTDGDGYLRLSLHGVAEGTAPLTLSCEV